MGPSHPLDSDGSGTVNVTLDIPPTTVTAWYTGSSSGVTTPGVGSVQLGAVHVTGIETLSSPPQQCSPPSSGSFGGSWQT